MAEARGRESRQQELRVERRRRDDATIDGSLSLKLAVPPEIQAQLTEQDRTWRWANDVDNRIYRLTVLDDWDKVDGVKPVEVVINKAKGLTCKAILLSKPKSFVDEDRRKADDRRKAQEQAFLQAAKPNPEQPYTAQTYVDQNSRIERGNQII